MRRDSLRLSFPGLEYVATIKALLTVALAWAGVARADDRPDAFPTFRLQNIETGLEVGWSLLVEDVNGDGKKDFIVVSPTHVVWCENPTWQPHTMVKGTTKRNNMTLTAIDLGSGRRNFALGGGWKPFETSSGSSATWLHADQESTAPWTPTLVSDEPMIHRIRFADVCGEGKPQLVVAPMMGRGSTAVNNWQDGRPVRLLVYRVPSEPTKDRWTPEVIDESLHVVHGLSTVERPDGKGVNLLIGSYEGVHLLARDSAGKWTKTQLGSGNQDNPQGSRGSSEVKQGKLKDGRTFLATIEPWHGSQFVIYTEPDRRGALWNRHVIDDKLKMGHAVWCADFNGDGTDEVIVGVQDNQEDTPGSRRGIRLYKMKDASGVHWIRHVLDDGVIELEDLAAVDLTGSGRLDIVAVGKESGTARIFWNEGSRKK